MKAEFASIDVEFHKIGEMPPLGHKLPRILADRQIVLVPDDGAEILVERDHAFGQAVDDRLQQAVLLGEFVGSLFDSGFEFVVGATQRLFAWSIQH